MKNLNRLKLLRTVVCSALLVGICFSFELWFPLTRTFPRAPVVFELPEALLVPVERLLTAVLIISLISIICFQRLKIFSIIAIASLILLILSDQTRLQPWVYQYLLILVALNLGDRPTADGSDPTLGLAQVVVAGLYFWSGVQKLNFSFPHEVLPVLLSPLKDLIPSIELPFVFVGIGIALVETFVGCGLLFRRTRNLSVYLAVAIHIFILGSLIAQNYNSIVWIWNAALIAILLVAFWRSDTYLRQTIQATGDWKWNCARSVVAASIVLPALSFVGWWDMYLSGALYSGNTEIAVIRINDDLAAKLPAKARETVLLTENNNEKMLPLTEWAMSELNVPAYPERRVSREVARKVCELTNEKMQDGLIVKERPGLLDGSYKISRTGCEELERR